MKILNWWLTPKFPKDHIEKIISYSPVGIRNQIRNFVRTWIIHPIKRRLAGYYLIALKRLFGVKVVGITGSAGKTTTKEMLASILKRKGDVVYSFANIDPVYNIPTTILRCKPSTEYLLLEMGIEYPREMDFYLWLAEPDVAVITNIYPTHTLYLGSVEGVAKEKGKIVSKLGGGTAVLNSENIYCKRLAKRVKGKVIMFGDKGVVKADNITFTSDLNTKYTLITPLGKIDIQLPILGEQFVKDSLAAASCAMALEVSLKDIKTGLERFDTQEHRMKPIKLRSGTTVLDDSYNNNPEAAKKALFLLNAIKGKRKTGVVFGDMLELGKMEEEYHREVGKVIGNYAFDFLIGVGQASKSLVKEAKRKMKGKAVWVENADSAYEILKQYLIEDSLVLVKGSRSIGLDKIISRLS